MVQGGQRRDSSEERRGRDEEMDRTSGGSVETGTADMEAQRGREMSVGRERK